MATRKRTTHRSSTGKKLYAVRDKSGRFKDIQTYERAHRADLARKAKGEGGGKPASKTVKKATSKKAPAKKAPARKAPAKKAPAKKAPARKPAAKKAPRRAK